jgi:hypothetical protein
MMKRLQIFAYAVCLVLIVTHGIAQDASPRPNTENTEAPHATSSARSFADLFEGLESDVGRAIQGKNIHALDSLLAPEFSIRSSMKPESPRPRAEWIQDLSAAGGGCAVDRRATRIRAFLGVAVVSFVQSCRNTDNSANSANAEYLIVDVWATFHSKWRISERYVAPVCARRSPH